ncbi:hypothetical protein M9434_002511 [Picochlorum sp. BPE23]|nr:hypothetical protein M9434_002511 [Picochlorum sp. BPE23]
MFWKKRPSVAESVLIQEMLILEEGQTRSDFQFNLELLSDVKDFEELRVKMHFPYTTSWVTLPAGQLSAEDGTLVRDTSKFDDNFSSRNPYMIVWVSYEQPYIMNTLDLGTYNKSGTVHFPHQFSHLPHEVRLLRGPCKGPLDVRGDCTSIGFQARNKIFSFLKKDTIEECFNNRTIVLIGDSRMQFLYHHFIFWALIKTTFWGLHDPLPRFGLGYLLQDLRSKLVEAQILGSYIVLHSILHDLVDFRPDYTTSQVRTHYNASACSTCIGKAEKCGCLSKSFAIRQFIENIKKLKYYLSIGGTKKVFWVSMNIRPPTVGYVPNKGSLHGLHTILFELETYAAREMESIGVKHIDLRPLLLSTPHYWWDDTVHFGKNVKNGNFSVFAHTISVAMFSKICSHL